MSSEIAPGVYRARGVSAALGETSKGSEQVAVEFELLDADGNPGPHITWYGHFTDKTLETTIKALRTCGWEGDDLSNLSGVDANEVSLVIEHEEYEGKLRARVRWVNAPGGGGLTLKNPLTPEKAKAFAARMRGQIRALEQGSAPKKAASTTKRSAVLSPEPPPITDDIPF